MLKSAASRNGTVNNASIANPPGGLPNAIATCSQPCTAGGAGRVGWPGASAECGAARDSVS